MFLLGAAASEAEPAFGAPRYIHDCWGPALSPLKEGHACLSPIKVTDQSPWSLTERPENEPTSRKHAFAGEVRVSTTIRHLSG